MTVQVQLRLARTLLLIPPAEHPQPNVWVAFNIYELVAKCLQTLEEVKPMPMQAGSMGEPSALDSSSWGFLSTDSLILSKQQFNSS